MNENILMMFRECEIQLAVPPASSLMLNGDVLLCSFNLLMWIRYLCDTGMEQEEVSPTGRG